MRGNDTMCGSGKKAHNLLDIIFWVAYHAARPKPQALLAIGDGEPSLMATPLEDGSRETSRGKRAARSSGEI